MSGETTLTIIGNLTRDPEIRFLEGGAALCKFAIASTPRRYDAKTNKWADGEPVFMDITAWRDLAEHVADSLSKGDRVIVTGVLKLDRWQTPEGDNRQKMTLTAEEVGPSLKWASAKPVKATRTTPGGVDLDDPWAKASPKRPGRETVGAAAGNAFADEPPF
ncbi:single-stranded DNA-binding protein [Phytomonospora endophytica]|uniref:Single-stranded DNA-binding protein n=1 Tax=Phytomonospora endophytica TaxID=714109 RepID=A0A841FQX6_9ACTN|nr:single-stranded DNA-binding protein [Phytomonospora endophytica]MBB6038234.1 single-strand DNA-binding protein [Phytomonospora endophytica]GIG67306.1 single-stranded DNA-binding protein [Phytomonospora endophytica]